MAGRKRTSQSRKPWTTYASIIALLIVSAVIIDWFPLGGDNVAGGWEICLDYAGEGKLFQGQPYCNKSPLIYYFGWAVGKVVGMENLRYGMMAAKAMLYAAMFVILRKILKRVLETSIILDALLFMVLIYPFGADKPDALLPSAFYLAGFYVQFVGRIRRREEAAGLLYALALFSKYIAAIPIAVSILTGAYFTWRKNGPWKAAFAASKTAAVILAVSAVMYVTHPDIWVYTVTSLVEEPLYSTSQTFNAIFDIKLGILAVAAMAAAHLWLLLKGRLSELEVACIIPPMVAIPFMLYSLTKTNGGLMFPGQYCLPVYPLLIVSAYALRKRKPLLFPLYVVFILVYPSISDQGPGSILRERLFQGENDGLKELVLSGWTVLPPPQKGLLFESDRGHLAEILGRGEEKYFAGYGWNITGKNNRLIRFEDIVIPRHLEDGFWGPRIRKLANISEEEYPPDSFRNSTVMEDIRGSIVGGDFDVIMFTPQEWYIAANLLVNLTQEEPNRFCFVKLPNFYHFGYGRIYSMVWYSNKSLCPIAAINLAHHYAKIFDEICAKSQAAAEAADAVNQQNHIQIGKTCDSKAAVNGELKKKPQLIDALAIAALIGAFALLSGTNINPFRKGHKASA